MPIGACEFFVACLQAAKSSTELDVGNPLFTCPATRKRGVGANLGFTKQ